MVLPRLASALTTPVHTAPVSSSRPDLSCCPLALARSLSRFFDLLDYHEGPGIAALRPLGSRSPMQPRSWLPARQVQRWLLSLVDRPESQREDRNENPSNLSRRSPLFRDGGRMQQDRTHGSAARPGSYYCCDTRTSRNSGYYSTGIYDGVHHSIVLSEQPR